MVHARRIHAFQKVLRRRRVVCSTARQQPSAGHSAAPDRALRCVGVTYQHQLTARWSGKSCTLRMRRVHCRRQPATTGRYQSSLLLPCTKAAALQTSWSSCGERRCVQKNVARKGQRRGAPVTMDSVCAEPNLWMWSMASSMESTSSSVSASVPYSCLGLGAAGSPSARVLFSPPYMVMSAGAQGRQEFRF